MLVVKKSVSIMDEEEDDCGDTIFGWMSIRMMVKKNFNLDIVKLEDDDANAKRRRLRHIPFSVTIIFISSVFFSDSMSWEGCFIIYLSFLCTYCKRKSMVADYTILSIVPLLTFILTLPETVHNTPTAPLLPSLHSLT